MLRKLRRIKNKDGMADSWIIIKETFKAYFSQNPFRHSAAIAFYTIFSLPGITIITLHVAASIYEKETVREQIINQIELLMGQSGADQLEMVMSKASISSDTFLMQVIGIGALLLGATTVFASLQQSLNAIWGIQPKPDNGVLKFLMTRFISLAMVTSIGFLMLVSLMADTLLAVLHDVINAMLEGISYYLVWVINLLVSFGMITLIFALIFKVLPDVRVKFRHVWLGAFTTTILFIAGKYAIGYYLSQTNVGDAYGTAGSLVAMLTWVYYSVLIVLLGAQFTYTYNSIKGHRIMPSKHAVAIETQKVEKEKSVTDIES